MLAHLGWDARPQVKLDIKEGPKLADSLKDFGCYTRYVSLVKEQVISALNVAAEKSALNTQYRGMLDCLAEIDPNVVEERDRLVQRNPSLLEKMRNYCGPADEETMKKLLT